MKFYLFEYDSYYIHFKLYILFLYLKYNCSFYYNHHYYYNSIYTIKATNI